MKALVLEAPGRLVERDCKKPEPKENEVLVKTKAATICTSDINDIKHNPFAIALPMILGHEGAGIIEGLGRGVAGFAEGDEIAAHPVMACGECASCRRNLSHLCDNMSHLGIDCGGTFAEYFTIRADRIRKKPANMSFAAATLLEPVCVCLEAIKRANVSKGCNVLIVGDGPFGIMIANICAQMFPGNKTIISGTSDFKLGHATTAKKININSCKCAAGQIQNDTGGEGIDSAFVCAGTPEALDAAIEACRSRGTICMFSAIGEKVLVDMFKVHVKELNICGSCNDEDYLDEAMEFISNGILADVITHQLPFCEHGRAFELASDKKSDALKVSLIL